MGFRCHGRLRQHRADTASPTAPVSSPACATRAGSWATRRNLAQGEASILEANANNGSNRWGDYASINIDPVDDCTFCSPACSVARLRPVVDPCLVQVRRVRTPDFYLASDPMPSRFAPAPRPPTASRSARSPASPNPVTLAASGHPAGTTASFSPNPWRRPPSTSHRQHRERGCGQLRHPSAAPPPAPRPLGQRRARRLHRDAWVSHPVAPRTAPSTCRCSRPSRGPRRPGATYSLEVDDDPGFGSPAITQSGIIGTSVTPPRASRPTPPTTGGDRGQPVRHRRASTVFSFTTLPAGRLRHRHRAGDRIHRGLRVRRAGLDALRHRRHRAPSSVRVHSGSFSFHANDPTTAATSASSRRHPAAD